MANSDVFKFEVAQRDELFIGLMPSARFGHTTLADLSVRMSQFRTRKLFERWSGAACCAHDENYEFM